MDEEEVVEVEEEGGADGLREFGEFDLLEFAGGLLELGELRGGLEGFDVELAISDVGLDDATKTAEKGDDDVGVGGSLPLTRAVEDIEGVLLTRSIGERDLLDGSSETDDDLLEVVEPSVTLLLLDAEDAVLSGLCDDVEVEALGDKGGVAEGDDSFGTGVLLAGVVVEHGTLEDAVALVESLDPSGLLLQPSVDDGVLDGLVGRLHTTHPSRTTQREKRTKHGQSTQRSTMNNKRRKRERKRRTQSEKRETISSLRNWCSPAGVPAVARGRPSMAARELA